MKSAKRWLRQHPEAFILCYFLFYFAAFFALEQFSKPKYIIHSPLDDLIPFCEWFILPYAFWYLWMPGALVYFLFKSKTDYLRLCFIMFGGMTICLALYLLAPTGLALRQPLPRENVLCQLVGVLRSVDPPTNVCPSIHISSTVAILLVALRSKLFQQRLWVKVFCVAITVLITLSTLFLQQHSVWDVLAGAGLSVGLAGVFTALQKA